MISYNCRIAEIVNTKEYWDSSTIVLEDGMLGFESDTGRYKAGNGVDAWGDLPYLNENADYITYNNGSGLPATTVQTALDFLVTEYLLQPNVDKLVIRHSCQITVV